MHFTIPIVKCSFFNIFFHTFLNEHFTIGKKEKEKGYYRYSNMHIVKRSFDKLNKKEISCRFTINV
jgi:hypothetical protein